MSLSINVNSVERVRIGEEWFDVKANRDGLSSFYLDSYEFIYREPGAEWDNYMLLHGGGNSGICATGFEFTTMGGVVIAGPLTAITAVEHGG